MAHVLYAMELSSMQGSLYIIDHSCQSNSRHHELMHSQCSALSLISDGQQFKLTGSDLNFFLGAHTCACE